MTSIIFSGTTSNIYSFSRVYSENKTSYSFTIFLVLLTARQSAGYMNKFHLTISLFIRIYFNNIIFCDKIRCWKKIFIK